jgi:hypothetical protein
MTNNMTQTNKGKTADPDLAKLPVIARGGRFADVELGEVLATRRGHLGDWGDQ